MAMTLRTDTEDEQALTRAAQRRGISKHQVVLVAIRALDARDARADRISSIADRMLEDWGPVFDALAKT
jgi:hypothetical protein